MYGRLAAERAEVFLHAKHTSFGSFGAPVVDFVREIILQIYCY